MPADFDDGMTAGHPRPILDSHAVLLQVAACDVMAASLRRIETLAALLRAPSKRVPCEPLDGEVVGEAAGMIADEIARIRAVLDLHVNSRP